MEDKEKPVKQPKSKFTKEALIKSKKYARHRILLKVLLEDGKSYSLSEVNTTIDNYLKKVVK